MRVSLNWLRYLNDKYQCAAEPAPDGVDTLVDKIGAQLGAVEEVIDLGKKYQGIVVVKVISCTKHPNADKLSVCLVDDGGLNKTIKRDKDNFIQIVCGAPNVKPGMMAAWIPPGRTVPSTYDKESFVMESREIRGSVSNGMLASAKELGLGEDHSGIVEIDQQLEPGSDFAKAYGLDDYVIDIENKMFTHRPDLFGMLGIAREVAGIQHHSFKSPAWYKEDSEVVPSNGDKLKLEIRNDVPKLVPRFCAIVIKGVKVGASPLFIRARLASVGIRPINNIVDLTNFLMMETAQPLHAYDYDKVKTGVLGIRLSQKGEQLKLLGGKIINIQEGSMIVTDGKKPIGLGGIMGGSDTEVDDNTKNIIIEVGNWNQNAIRKSAMAHGLFTDAATRFTKNQSPRQNRAVIVRAAEDVLKVAGGRVARGLFDDKYLKGRAPEVKTSLAFINSRLGLNLSALEVKKLLENVEFQVQIREEELLVNAPFWRTDIEIPEDITEEVGRLLGYDRLPVELPKRSILPAARNQKIDLKQRVRQILSAAGANEALTYSFVHGKLFNAVGQDQKKSFKIANAISPELQYYRQSLTPSLLEKVHPNIKAGFDEFVMFEIGTGHTKDILDEEKLPAELRRLSLVVASKIPKQGSAYYWAKKYCNYLIERLGEQKIDYLPVKPDSLQKTLTYYEPTRSAEIKRDDTVIGRIGEISPAVKSNLKLPAFCAGFDIDLEELAFNSQSIYKTLNRFPPIEQDLTLRSGSDINYVSLTNFLEDSLRKLSKDSAINFTIEPIDIFQKTDDTQHKNTTWRLSFENPQRTMTTAEASAIMDSVAKSAKEELKADRI